MQQGSPLAATCNESRFLQHAAKARTCCALSYFQQQAKSMTNRSGCHPEQAFMLRKKTAAMVECPHLAELR